jgi:hypothetical protein
MYDPVLVGDRPIFPCNPSKHPTKIGIEHKYPSNYVVIKKMIWDWE